MCVLCCMCAIGEKERERECVCVRERERERESERELLLHSAIGSCSPEVSLWRLKTEGEHRIEKGSEQQPS